MNESFIEIVQPNDPHNIRQEKNVKSNNNNLLKKRLYAVQQLEVDPCKKIYLIGSVRKAMIMVAKSTIDFNEKALDMHDLRTKDTANDKCGQSYHARGFGSCMWTT